jgi:[ribosomal protein S5]-alanine N-acetyltransferase
MATSDGVLSQEEIQLRLNSQLTHWENHGFGIWVASLASTGQFVGRGGLRHVDLENKDEVEVGYAVLPDFWGRGLATELALSSVTVGFRQLGLAFSVRAKHYS